MSFQLKLVLGMSAGWKSSKNFRNEIIKISP